MPGGASAMRKAGYLDTNYTWYQVLVSVAVPLSAGVTTANVQDNQVYGELTCSLPSTTIKETSYMTAYPGYDDHELYDLSTSLGFH